MNLCCNGLLQDIGGGEGSEQYSSRRRRRCVGESVHVDRQREEDQSQAETGWVATATTIADELVSHSKSIRKYLTILSTWSSRTVALLDPVTALANL